MGTTSVDVATDRLAGSVALVRDCALFSPMAAPWSGSAGRQGISVL
ncbi:hypothetical protein ACFVZW_25090 [Streptomyces sp. NPDC059567]